MRDGSNSFIKRSSLGIDSGLLTGWRRYLLYGTSRPYSVSPLYAYVFSAKNSRKADASGISSFQAFCTSLAARVGTGNMAGVAVALTVGGPGAIFWMWLIAMVGMATAFAESTLAQLYKTKGSDGNYIGGPAYYMEKGLGMRWMGILFSIFLIIAFGLVFNAVQSNSIADAMHTALLGIKQWSVGFWLCFQALLFSVVFVRSLVLQKSLCQLWLSST